MSWMFVSIQFRDKIVPQLDIHCVLSDGYISFFDLLYLSIVFCVKHGYIGSFKQNWICFVFCQVKWMDSLNLSIGTI
jgi:hypothetical protein